MAKNWFNTWGKNVLDDRIDYILNKNKNFSDYEKDVVKDTLKTLETLYGKDLDYERILDNLSDVKDFKYTTYYDKDGVDDVKTRGSLTHDIISQISKDEGLEIWGMKDEFGKIFNGIDNRAELTDAMEAALTESITASVMKQQGYNYDSENSKFSEASKYGDIIFEMNESKIVDNYFEKYSDLARDKNFEDINKAMEEAFSGKYDSVKDTDALANLNKEMVDYLANSKNLAYLYGSNSVNDGYTTLIQEIKDLPGMSQENVDYLNYKMYNKGLESEVNDHKEGWLDAGPFIPKNSNEKLDIREWTNPNSNLNVSLQIVDVMNTELAGQEFNMSDTNYKIIRGIGGNDQVVFNANDKVYSFIDNGDGTYSNFKEYQGDLKLTNSLFTPESYNSKVDANTLDCVKLVEDFKNTNWGNEFKNTFELKDRYVFDAIKGNEISTENIVHCKDFKDVNDNNILHIVAEANGKIDANNFDFSGIIKGFEGDSYKAINELMSAKNAEGKTPLDVALENGNYEAVNSMNELINRYNVKDFTNGDALQYAAQNEDVNYKYVYALAKNDNIDVKEVDENNRNALHNLLYNNDNAFGNDKFDEIRGKAIETLVKEGIDVNAECYSNEIEKSKDGVETHKYITPLQIASGLDKSDPQPDYEAMHSLIKAGADIKRDTNSYESPLKHAHETGDVNMFKVFINNGYKMDDLMKNQETTLTKKEINELNNYQKDFEMQEKMGKTIPWFNDKENRIVNTMEKEDEIDLNRKSIFERIKEKLEEAKDKIQEITKDSEKGNSILDKLDKDGNGKIDIFEKGEKENEKEKLPNWDNIFGKENGKENDKPFQELPHIINPNDKGNDNEKPYQPLPHFIDPNDKRSLEDVLVPLNSKDNVEDIKKEIENNDDLEV